jgi:hypothetical protein
MCVIICLQTFFLFKAPIFQLNDNLLQDFDLAKPVLNLITGVSSVEKEGVSMRLIN